MRLDKFLSQQLGISRTQITRELRAKQVTVNGEKVKNGALQIEPEHQVVYNGQVISYLQGQRYFMLHKPSGYVCANDDPIHPTVFYFIVEPMREKLHSVGRLDRDTTGLVLLTDDGVWSHRITSPKHHCEKSYLVTLAQAVSPEVAVQFAQGIGLKGEKNITKPAHMECLGEKKVRLTLSEGRYHQVKRMFAAVGNHVLELHRERIGNIVLDNKLPEGKYRPLTADEIANVIKRE